MYTHTHTHIYIYIHPTQPHEQDVTQGHFLAEFSRSEFKAFLFLGRLLHQGYRIQSARLFTSLYIYFTRTHTHPHTPIYIYIYIYIY